MFGLYTKKQYDYVERDRKKAESKAEFFRANLEELYRAQSEAFNFLIKSLETEKDLTDKLKQMYEASEKVRQKQASEIAILNSQINGLREQLRAKEDQ